MAATKGEVVPSTDEADLCSKKIAENFDQALAEVGEFGRYQEMVVVVMFVMMMIISSHAVLMCFAATPPSWKCIKNSSTCLYNGTLSGDNLQRCRLPRDAWTYIDPAVSVISEFHIDCEKRWWIDVMSSVFFVGWCVGACVMGWLGEKYGRKLILLLSVGSVLALGFAASFSPNVYIFTVFRFIIGFVASGVQSQAVVLASEITGTKWRGIAVTATISGYSVGCALTSLVAYRVHHWRWILIYSTVPYVILGVFVKFLPESPRWLLIKGRTSAYESLMKRMAKWNRKTVSIDLKTFSNDEKIESLAKSSVMGVFRHGVVKALVQAYFTFCLGVTFYGILLSAQDLGGNMYTDMVALSLTDLPSNFVLAWSLTRFGRKVTIVPSMAVSGAICLAIAFTPHQSTFNIVRTVLGMVGKFFVNFAFCGIFTWTAELYPTTIRSTAMGFFQFTMHTGAVCAPWIAQGLLYLSSKAPFTLMGLMALVAAGLAYLLPETRNTSVE